MATNESENFYRLVSLLVDIGTEVIRRLFLKYAVTPPAVTSVTQFLVQEQNIIARLDTKRVLGPAQLALLQPPPGQVVDPQHWDISLLCILLKNICPITQLERNEIDSVRTVRNQIYGHRAAATMSDVDFVNQWGVVEASVKTIANCTNDTVFENHVAKYIDNVKNGPLDVESTAQVLMQWSRNEDIVQSRLGAVDTTLDGVAATVQDLASRPKIVDHVFENLKEQTRILLAYKCKQPFVPTKQFAKALAVVGQNGSVIISGKPGEGKTMAAYHIVERMGLSDRCICLYNPTQWDHVDTDEIDIIILDDVFGKHQLETGTLESWIPVLQNIEAYVNSGQLKVVLTSRWNVLYEARLRLEKIAMIRNNIIELTSGALNREEKCEILNTLLDFHEKDKFQVDIQKCCDVYKANIGFPYCCFLFTADQSLFDLKEKFFKQPVQFFKESLGALSKNIKASLLFLFYMQGQCSEKDLKWSTRSKKNSSEQEEIITKVSYLVGICDEDLSLAQVRDILDGLSGTYVTHLSKTFTFAHNIVYECVALMHGKKYPEEVIEYCTWNFIKGCVVTEAAEDETKLIIDKDLYENLCSRFIHETIEKSLHETFYDVRTHSCMRTKEVCVTLCKMLAEQGKLMKFLTCLMQDNQGGFLYGYLITKDKDDKPLLVEAAIPHLKCNCEAESFSPCWKCHVRNDTARAACVTGDSTSYSLMLEEGIRVLSDSIRDASRGENPDLLKLVISTVKARGKFIPEEVPVSKSLVLALKSKDPKMFEVLLAEGAVVMPLCVYDAVIMKDLALVAQFVTELKRNAKWDPADFWLQKALEESISFHNPDICNLLRQEGLIFHRGCLLSAVKSKEIIKVKETVSAMKALGTWQPSDRSYESELKKFYNAVQSGNAEPLTVPSLADVGVIEALIEAKQYEDKSIYEYLLSEGVQVAMENLPPAVKTRQTDLVMELIDELKDQGKWDPKKDVCATALLQAMRQNLTDIFDLLVSEGITCTMGMLPKIMSEKDITVKDVENLVAQIKKFGNWHPNRNWAEDGASMQVALMEAFKRDDMSIYNYLIENGAKINSTSVLTAVISQDIDTVRVCLDMLRISPDWDPSDEILNLVMQLSKAAMPEIYTLLLDVGVGYSSKSLVSAAARNDSSALMIAVNELKERKGWNPETDSNVTKSLELVCQHNNMMMFNVLQKKKAKLSVPGIFSIIHNTKSLWYAIGPEYRKVVEHVPSLAALITASLAKQFLVCAFQQKQISVYIRMIHALEETGQLDRNDPLLHDALVAAIESGDILGYNTAADTGTEVSEEIVMKLLLCTSASSLRIEFPERLTNRIYRTCVMQCLLESIRKGNIKVLEETTLMLKQNTLWCPDDNRIIQAIQEVREDKRNEIFQKLFELKLITKK